MVPFSCLRQCIFFAGLRFYPVLKVPAAALGSSWKVLLAASFSMAATSLVKPHALFLTLGLWLFFLFSSKWRTLQFGNRLLASLLFLGTTIAVKLLGGFVLAGPKGATLFGGYGSVGGLFQLFLSLAGLSSEENASISSSTDINVDPSDVRFFELTLQQFGLHFLAMGFLLAPAWYVFFATKFSVKSSVAELAFFSMGTIMIVVSAFSAYVTTTGDDHTD